MEKRPADPDPVYPEREEYLEKGVPLNGHITAEVRGLTQEMGGVRYALDCFVMLLTAEARFDDDGFSIGDTRLFKDSDERRVNGKRGIASAFTGKFMLLEMQR